MKKVSVFTVLTCFLAGTANFSCYAGNIFGSPDKPEDDRSKTQSPTSGRGAGRGGTLSQPLAPAGRGAGRGSLPVQSSTSVGRGSDQSRVASVPKPAPASDVPDFPGTFDDESLASNAQQMTPAELAMVEQLIKEGKLRGVSLTSNSTVSSVGGLVEGERGGKSGMPSPNPAPSPTTSTLESERDAEQSTRPSPSPACSSNAIDGERIKDDNAISFFIPGGATIDQKENYRVASVPLVCALTEWDYYSAAARNAAIRQLYSQALVAEEGRLLKENPTEYINRLKFGVRWVKHYLSQHGKTQNKEQEAKGFSQLIETRLNSLITEVEESINSGKEPSFIIRFLHDKDKKKICFSVERSLGKVILVEIPGQE